MRYKTLSRSNQKILLSIACGLFIFSTLEAQVAGTISHQPVFQHVTAEPLVIYATVASAVEVNLVVLLFRQSGEEGYIDVEMDRTAEGWVGEIPVEYFSSDGLEYYLSATLVDESVLTFPEDNPEEAPLLVQIVPPSEPAMVPEQVEAATIAEEVEMSTGNGGILVFSPVPGSKVPFDDVMIAASLYNVDSLDVSSIRLSLDGRDVTEGCEVGIDLVVYEPPSMFPGVHQIRIEAKKTDGSLADSKSWSFTTVREAVEEAGRVEQELSYRGRINGGYSYDLIDEGNPLEVSQTAAAFSGEWRALRFKTDLKLSTEEDPFKQPRNRYRFNLTAGKYLTLNLGDFNSRISRFTLDGKRVR